MDEKKLKSCIKAGLTQRQMAEELDCSQSNVRYWLNKYELQTIARGASNKKCVVCGKNLENRRRKKCASCNTAIRRLRNKMAAIKMLGGCCAECGWEGPPAGFDFHHINGDKDYGIGQLSNRSWEVIKKELKKCILLCKICHAIEHSNHLDEKLLEQVIKYKGRILDF